MSEKEIIKKIKGLMDESKLHYTSTCDRKLKTFIEEYFSGDELRDRDFYYRSKGKGEQSVLVIVSTKNDKVHELGVAMYKSEYNGDSKKGHLPSCLEMTDDKFKTINIL